VRIDPIPYSFTRDSVAAIIDPFKESRLVVENQPVVGYPGVRGGGGFLVMPSVEQLFYDNYLGNQTLDAAIGSPWTSGDGVARDENALLGGLSVEMPKNSTLYQVYQTADVLTFSAFVYIPPPMIFEDINLYIGDGSTSTDILTLGAGIVSLGDYWYFIFDTFTGQNGATDRWGIVHANTGNDTPIWVDCLSLTETPSPVGFVPNASASATETSEDDDLMMTLKEPLPQSGSLSFVFIPFYDKDDSVDAALDLLSIYPSGGAADDDIRMGVGLNTNGLFVYAETVDGGDENTTDDYALTDWVAFVPHEIVIRWDLQPGGTKLTTIFVDGELQTESVGITVMPEGLVDVWIGVRRAEAAVWANHAQVIIQDLQFHGRT